jgi:glutamyl-tRNA reductase
VLVVTCNRIELYVASCDIAQRHSELVSAIKQPFTEHLEKRFYTFMGQEALLHLSQVASGLDSLIEGETDIQHQIKKAYLQNGRHLNADGHYLFQKALHIAKKLRSEFDIKPLKNLEDLVVATISLKLGRQDHLVFIGNSDLNRKIMTKLSRLGSYQVTLVTQNRCQDESIWKEAKIASYEDFDKIEHIDGLICASKDKKLTVSDKVTGFICDLSRPKVIQHTGSCQNVWDLSYFEQLSVCQRINQKSLRQQALLYLNENVKRLMEHRLMKQSYVAI